MDPEAPEWFNPYTVEHLKLPETMAELHDIYYLNRSESERLVALEVLRMAWLGEAGMEKEKAFPEDLAADALYFMGRMQDAESRWRVLSCLAGLEYPIVRDEALAYLQHDPDPRVRKRAAAALAPFREEPEIQALLRSAASSDFSHEVRSYAKASLAGNRYSER